jgi:hypothetical protein
MLVERSSSGTVVGGKGEMNTMIGDRDVVAEMATERLEAELSSTAASYVRVARPMRRFASLVDT